MQQFKCYESQSKFNMYYFMQFYECINYTPNITRDVGLNVPINKHNENYNNVRGRKNVQYSN